MITEKKIIVVEDNLAIRDLISYILTGDGYRLLLCGTASEFDNNIKADLPDLILLDIMLPDGNGLDMCKRLKANESTSHIPVLLMSANNNSADAIKACSAEGFISKPFDIDDFLKKVHSYL